MFKRKKTITVIYKSGAKVTFRAEDFAVKRYQNGNKEVAWIEPSPKPLLFGVDDVESIWEGEV